MPRELQNFYACHKQSRELATKHYVFDWYVDSNLGDDGNNGKTPQSPLKSILALSTKYVMPGNRIGLARGSHWREQLNAPCTDLYISAYGSGTDPILDASDIITGFAKTGGRVNVYEKAVTTTAGLPLHYINGWENGIFLTRAISIANCDATPGSHYPTAEGGMITWYIHPGDSGNPNTNGRIYEISTREMGLNSIYENLHLSHIITQRNQHEGGSLQVSRNSTVSDCIAYDGSKHNIYIKDGCVFNRVQAVRAYDHASSRTLFVWNENTPIGLGITFNDCVADNTGCINAGMTGFYGHRNVGGTFGNITLNRCNVINCYRGYEGLDGLITLNDCITDDTVTIAVSIWNTPVVLNNCDLHAESTIIEFMVAGQQYTVNGGIFTILNPGASRNMILVSAPYSNISLVLNGVTISNQSLPYPITVISYASGTHIDVQHCTWTHVALNACHFVDATGAVIVMDYNSYKAISGWYINPNGYNFAQWQALGYDMHSTHI